MPPRPIFQPPWPTDVVAPEVDVTIAHRVSTNEQYIVRDIIRYNPPPEGRFGCHVQKISDPNIIGAANVWRDYIYYDLDGGEPQSEYEFGVNGGEPIDNPAPPYTDDINEIYKEGEPSLTGAVIESFVTPQFGEEWKCDTYERTHYRDVDGVTKNM